MKPFLVVLSILAGCSRSSEEPPPAASAPAPAATAPKPSPPPAAKPVDDIDVAQAAYDAKQWAKCAELYSAIADRAKPPSLKLEATYNAGCCYAQAGKRDAAFPLLERAVSLGFRDKKHVETDPDLAGVHDDARWPKLLAAIDKANADREKSIKEPALRNEILAMADEDQKARTAWIAKQDDRKLAEAVADIDKKDTKRMKEIVAKHGWPGKSLVGEDGANAAWLLVQHADQDHAFQKEVLAKMEPLAKTGEVSAINTAYLYDRVAVGEHRKQLYGTQFQGDQPQPIEDEANVDARRSAIGLPSLAEYRKQIMKMNGPKKN